jgi:hypothetical protein
MTSKSQGSRGLWIGQASAGATWARYPMDSMRRLSYTVELGWRCQAYNLK